MALSFSDRIASIKAGLLSATSVGVTALVSEWLNDWVYRQPWGQSWVAHASFEQEMGAILLAIISGFLFGVTYRYIRREDPNPHLRTGAIAAFGLVRGLAQIDTGFLLQGNLGQMTLLAGESLVMMAIAALGLDWALSKQWIEPISSP